MKHLYARFLQSSGPAALIVAVLALVVSTAGVAAAVSYKSPSKKPRPNGLLLLGGDKKFPASAIPKVRSAKRADGLSKRGYASIKGTCAADSVDIGTYCLLATTYPVPSVAQGKNNYFWATQQCAQRGGWLPTAEQLLGAVDRVALASTIDDDPHNASVDTDATDGLKDRREMTATLVTTAAGSSAAGSQGVTAGSRGDPNQGEADPIPAPANPYPGTLQYVTVYDNRNLGGFAGSKPVSEPERFRCAFAKVQARDQRKPIQ